MSRQSKSNDLPPPDPFPVEVDEAVLLKAIEELSNEDRERLLASLPPQARSALIAKLTTRRKGTFSAAFHSLKKML